MNLLLHYCKETNCGKFISVYQHSGVVICITTVSYNPTPPYRKFDLDFEYDFSITYPDPGNWL
jgi:hypothetical protein